MIESKSEEINISIQFPNPQEFKSSVHKSNQNQFERTESKFSERISEFKLRNRKRWGRKDDRKLFKLIRNSEANGILTLKEILQFSPTDMDLPNQHIIQLVEESNWRQSPKELILRVKNLMRNDFSVREGKDLKNIIKKSKYKNLNYEQILEYFPGKTLERIIQVSDLV